MKEYSFIIRETLSKGLVDKGSSRIDALGMTNYQALQPTSGGAVVEPAMEDVIQVLRGKQWAQDGHFTIPPGAQVGHYVPSSGGIWTQSHWGTWLWHVNGVLHVTGEHLSLVTDPEGPRTSGFVQPLVQSVPNLKWNTAYYVKYTLSGYLRGNVRVKVGIHYTPTRFANGTYYEYVSTNFGNTIEIVPSTTFVGKISDFSVQEIVGEWGVQFANDWPFPQLFHGQGYTLACNRNSVYIVDTNLQATKLVTFDPENIADVKNVVAGGLWQCADLGKTLYLCNGECLVYLGNLRELLAQGDNKAILISDFQYLGVKFPINSIAYDQGRVFLGGLGADFFNPLLQGVFGTLNGLSLEYESFQNMVFASPIGEDALVYLISLAYAREGLTPGEGYSSARTAWEDLLKRNDLVWMPMPTQGMIQAMLPLGSSMIVYSTDGVAQLNPVAEPIVTLGLAPILDIGIGGRGCVGGDRREHLFIGMDRNLYKYNPHGGITRLGYRDYMKTLNLDNTVITLDPAERRYYICDNNVGYCYYPTGLVKSNIDIRSIVVLDKVYAAYFDAIEDLWILETDIVSMLGNMYKYITSVEIVGDDLENVEVQIVYRSSMGEWVWHPWIPCTPDGYAYPSIAAQQFRILARGKLSPGKETRVAYINVRYKVIDKRNIRGPFANQVAEEPA